ncbi:NAD(+) diphosphatase [Vibrio algarum]|uniref:NAD-capped RNA hydrolase NudC n=1 Tax=Vibrio algarum TaxID=3020714 RepID=A0ABT4YMG5_9VIBR|nr:NAD(+) diphosphatase [Vibrio sp. KJ40-1]MDB1122723.1 NAD(+) diphosphatase [Vibrio sp. KJ40-1]
MLKNSVNDSELDAYWIVVSNSDIWLLNKEIPLGTAEQLNLPSDKAIKIGEYFSKPVMWVNEADVERVLELDSLRENLLMPQELFLLASKAVQYGHMIQSQRFCAQCGGRNFLNHNEIAMQCGECRTIHYPRIFPCVIVAVRKEGQILLAQHPQHKGGMYTVIAGFLEVGETLEQCVAREVKEEAGINIKNIRYFGSQPWAFPTNMMVAFLADYDSGDIEPDYTELADVKWFEPKKMPIVAPEGTIARALIDKTIEEINLR